MKEQIVFGDRLIPVTLPDSVQVVAAGWKPAREPSGDLDQTVQIALDEPLGLPPIRELVRPGSKVTIAFDDPTTPCMAPAWEAAIRHVIAELEKGGVMQPHITLLCANGLHRKFTRRELALVMGDDLVREFSYNLRCHDAEDPAGVSYLGITESGYEVEVNRLVTDSDLTVYVSTGGRPGFSEGWRSICVGLGSYRSIRWLHSADNTGSPEIPERMLAEMGALVEDKIGKERIFKMEAVLSGPNRVQSMWGGRINEVQQTVLEENPIEIHPEEGSPAEKADIILYGIPDWSPWAVCGEMDPILTLISTGLGYLGGVIETSGKPGCAVILASPCPDRWDDRHHPAHREIWDQILPLSLDPHHIMDQHEEDFAHRPDYLYRYRFCYGFHPMHSLINLSPLNRLRHAGRVFAAGGEAPDLVEHLGFEPVKTIEEAIIRALSIHGKDASIFFVKSPPVRSRR